MGMIQILTKKIWCLLYIQNYILIYRRKDITFVFKKNEQGGRGLFQTGIDAFL